MTAAARSLFVFGIYVLVAGAGLLLAPAVVLAPLQLAPPSDGWIRVVGLLALVVGGYDILGARSGDLRMLRASVWFRIGFAAGTAALVGAGAMPAQLLVFGAMDVAGAVWTALTMRRG
jgi:hypothetical protein